MCCTCNLITIGQLILEEREQTMTTDHQYTHDHTSFEPLTQAS